MGSALSPLRDNVIFVGEWQLNIKQQTISDGVHTRELEPLLFKLLCFFIENNERIITRQELVENIWQQSFVDDNAINRAISELRKVLKSEKQPGQTIKTHYRKGYSLFIAVRPLEQAPIAEPVVVANEETKPHLSTNTISEKNTHSSRWPWPFVALVLSLLIAATWLYIQQPQANVEAQEQAPFLDLQAETITWHKGTHYRLLLSQDKTKLAYILQNDKKHLYVVDLTTKREYQIASGELFLQGWSEDGERLFYGSCEGDDYNDCITWQASNLLSNEALIKPRTNQSVLNRTPSQYMEVGNVAITRRNNYRGLTHLYALYAQDLKTGEEIRITSPNITGTGDFILTTIQNPSRIIFERHNVAQAEIYMANLDGSSLKLLTTNNYRSWAATYDEQSNSLVWYNRGKLTIESFSFDTMSRGQPIKAPVKRANYAYPLNKHSVLISTDIHDSDAALFDLKSKQMSYIATANKHEDDLVALTNNDVYFADFEYYKRQHWLRKDNQYIDITDKLGEDTAIIAANSSSSKLVSFNKTNQQLTLLNANDFSEIKHWTLPGNTKLAAVRGNKIAVIYTELSSLQNQIMILHTNSDEVVKSTIDTPLAIAWYDETQLIVHSKYEKYLLLDSDSNTYSELTTPDKLTELKPSIISMTSNQHSLYIATETEVYSIKLANLQDVELALQMQPLHFISQLNASNDKLAISFLTANSQNSIELYTEKSAE
ncbi:winged helix-turn-helix domain-containing protein [Pseudoalteromonas sp. OFAV1]|uniref:winged helix-turn-helix domain-containing protein n=1 Tax=Pseudoalteromonas sp. OFAV1 TaxID=2908892 RepID=UPI001F245C1F|nr:winged helix-turn-helix domain-containing protein [Pseudoalteromonas sp. OFAV1]MCF2902377.1 winged helix-turn-helix domain-containing protein [Pseudoalteromonas sp. OFAV1]